MKIQEELKQIIEAEKENDIIPFIKKLSKEDKKNLVPFLKKQIKYYHEFLKSGNTYSYRGTEKQRRIIQIAGFSIFNLKDYTSKLGGYDEKIFDLILDFYCPSWFNEFINSRADEEFAPQWMSYDWILKKQEQGIINPSESLLVKMFPRIIYPRKEGSYDHIFKVENLEKHEVTLKEHFWYIFKYETEIYFANRYMRFDSDTGNEEDWISITKKLVDEEKLSRQRVLKESLNATNRNFNRNLINWYIDLFLALKPTVNESLENQNDLFQTFNSTQSKPVNEVLKLCKKLVLENDFDGKSFLENVPVLLASETKSIVNSTLMILDKLGKKEPESKNVIALLCCGAFLQTDKSVQNRASKIIKKYGNPSDENLLSELSMYEGELMSEVKDILNDFFQNKNIEKNMEEEEEDFEPQIVRHISAENKIDLPENIDDFIFLVSQIFDGNASWHIDFLPAALLKFHDQIDIENALKLLPAVQRAQKIVFNFTINNRVGYLENLMAHFFLEYMDFLMKKFPESKEYQKLISHQNKKNEKKKRDRGSYEPPTISLKYWYLGQKEEYYFPFKFLLEEAFEKLKTNEDFPLLSTPTHQPYWLDPKVYIERLSEYQIQNKTPNRVDWQMAISRLAMENLEENIKYAKAKLKGEWLDMTLFILQEAIVPPKKSSFFNEWKMAVYAKFPVRSIEQLKTQFPSFKVDKKLLGELDTNLKQVKTWKHFYNAKTKKYDKKRTLEAQLFIDEKDSYSYNETNNKSLGQIEKYNEKDFFLLKWLYLEKSHYLGSANDIPRTCSLIPKNLQPLLSQIESSCMRYSTFWEEEFKKLKLKTVNVLLENWIEGGEIAHLSIATGMICSDKTIREISAEIWIKGVDEDSINHTYLGQLIGKLAAIDYFPLKRMADLITASLFKVSKQHNRKLEILIQEIILYLPIEPIRNTKKILESYYELLKMNQSLVTDENLKLLLEKWKSNSSLKKIVTTLLK